MIELDFYIEERKEAYYRRLYGKLATASEEELRYYLFQGGFTLIVDECDLSANWGWVPILDFSSCLYWCAKDIATGKEAVFEFTESDEKIYFEKSGPTVRVSSDYAECEGQVGYEEFLRAADDFSQRVILQLSQTYPELRRNEELRNWYANKKALALLTRQ